MTISERLIEIREENNLTHDEFAKELGTSRPQLYAYMREEQKIPDYRLDKIESKYNVRREWVLNEEGEKYITNEFEELNKKLRTIKKLENFGIWSYLEALPSNLSKSKKKTIQDFLRFVSLDEK